MPNAQRPMQSGQPAKANICTTDDWVGEARRGSRGGEGSGKAVLDDEAHVYGM